MEVAEYNKLAKELEETLNLRTYPIAVKFFEKLEDVPEDAIFPKRDLGKRCAFCQAMFMARMNGRTVAMSKEDHWCWNPLVAFGVCKADVDDEAGKVILSVLGIKDPDKAREFWDAFPRLELGKYPYVVVAPAFKATFEPDVILIYSNTHQIVWEIGAVRFMTGEYLKSDFDSIDSCIHEIIEPWKNNTYKITFPDPGDKARAMAREDEVVLTVPGGRFGEFCEGIQKTKYMYDRYRGEVELSLENEVPPFYHELFKIWGVE